MRFTYGLDQSLEGQVRARSLAPRAFHRPPPHPAGIRRASRRPARQSGRAHPPGDTNISADRRRMEHRRNFPDGVWIFDCDNSVDAVERITRDSIASNCADTVPIF